MAAQSPSTEKDKQTIETVFLKEFIRQVIINSKPKSRVDPEIIQRVKAKLALQQNMPIVSIPKAPPQPIQKPLPKSLPRPIPKVLPVHRPIQPHKPIQMPPHRLPPPAPKHQNVPKAPERKIAAPTKESHKEPVNFGKLQPLFLDRSVIGIECPGASKNILVNHAGRIQQSEITLSPQEITDILQEFSQKTKIPVVSGIFKALYNNYLITAIISETAGNRFIIEKQFGQPSLPKKEDIR